ncbi:phage protein NinX family protein [Yersinia alsatica]|uniref:phage protein NinX family protein n=1 Tax=Yersinia alsatica TaxID=2890317 RepID=UPI0011A59B42|nr:phage protein NinX family protein [Yersinia alsatica]
MKDYSAMSDFEINTLVAEIVFGEIHPMQLQALDFGVLSYCKNIEDAWPIIAANRINVEWHEYKDDTFKPYALSNETMIGCYDDNPLRAAMIVFLMMKEKGDD